MDLKSKLINDIRLETGADVRMIKNNFSITNWLLCGGYIGSIALMFHSATLNNFILSAVCMMTSLVCGFLAFMRLIVWDKK